MTHPRDMGAKQVEAFLTMLATERKVSALPHNQALSALLFLRREVLEEVVGRSFAATHDGSTQTVASQSQAVIGSQYRFWAPSLNSRYSAMTRFRSVKLTCPAHTT
jgi:hypothetical protein